MELFWFHKGVENESCLKNNGSNGYTQAQIYTNHIKVTSTCGLCVLSWPSWYPIVSSFGRHEALNSQNKVGKSLPNLRNTNNFGIRSQWSRKQPVSQVFMFQAHWRMYQGFELRSKMDFKIQVWVRPVWRTWFIDRNGDISIVLLLLSDPCLTLIYSLQASFNKYLVVKGQPRLIGWATHSCRGLIQTCELAEGESLLLFSRFWVTSNSQSVKVGHNKEPPHFRFGIKIVWKFDKKKAVQV